MGQPARDKNKLLFIAESVNQPLPLLADHSLLDSLRDKFTTKMKIIALLFVLTSVASGEMPLTVVNPSADLTPSLHTGVQVCKVKAFTQP